MRIMFGMEKRVPRCEFIAKLFTETPVTVVFIIIMVVVGKSTVANYAILFFILIQLDRSFDSKNFKLQLHYMKTKSYKMDVTVFRTCSL